MVDICRGANPRYFHFKYGFKNLRRKNRENCRNNPQVWVINDAIDCLRKGNKQLLTCLFRLVQLSTEETSPPPYLGVWMTVPPLSRRSGSATVCRAGGRGFDSRGRTNTRVLKMLEKWRYSLCPANGQTFAWLGWLRKMAVLSPVGDLTMVSQLVLSC